MSTSLLTSSPNIQQIRVLSTILAHATLALGLALPVMLVWVWLQKPGYMIAQLTGHFPTTTPSLIENWAAILLCLVPVLVLCRGLWATWQCFQRFAKGNYLSSHTVTALCSLGGCMAVAGTLGLIVPTLLGLLISRNAAEGEHLLIISIGSSTLLQILFGGLVWVIGKIMALAVQISEDYAQIV
jgi:uncharacterized membrane protein YidH (DUF202 family)